MVQNNAVIQSAITIPRFSFLVNGSQSQRGLQYPELLEKISGGLHGNEG